MRTNTTRSTLPPPRPHASFAGHRPFWLVLGLVLGTSPLDPVMARAQEVAAKPDLERQIHSVEWLLGEREQWAGWAAIRRRMTIEGRYAFVTGTKLRMQECPDLDFVPFKEETLPRIVSTSRTVEVEGRFGTDDDDEVVFLVSTITPRPTDADVFRTRRAGLLRGSPDEWYALADWAEGRAKFYEDDELLASAHDARVAGVTAERVMTPKGDAEGLLALATKVERFAFSPRLVAELRHEGWRAKWEALGERKDPATVEELKTFAEGLAKALPGTEKPAATVDEPKDEAAADLAKSYRLLPNNAYAAADDAARLSLHRLFFADVTLQRLLREVDPALRNEEEVAGRIVALIPEHADIADGLRETALQRELSRVPSMTRQEMSALAERFRKAGDPARAGKVVGDWLVERERIGREDGADGLLRVADQYESLTADKDKVAALLIEAHKRRPDSKEAATRLAKLGYSLQGGQWTTEVAARPGDGHNGPGGVTVGMSSAQVTSVLGSPRAVSRVATAGRLNEVWIYGPRDAAGFAIHIVRETARTDDRGRVVRISERRPR